MLRQMHGVLQRFLQRHLQAIKRSMSAIKRTPWSTGATVFVIALTLILPLLFWCLVGELKPLMTSFRQGKEITLYLDESFKPADETDLMGRIDATKGVMEARFISSEASLAALEKQDGMENIRQYLPDNPLSAMIEVMPANTVDTPEKIEKLFQALKQYPHVEQVSLNRDWVSRLYAMIDFLSYFTWSIGLLFSLMVVFIIRNLLRLAAQEHHEEIQVLKLIGATDAFILRPFLYTGACLGVLGALFALLGSRFLLWGFDTVLRTLPGFSSGISAGLSVRDALSVLLFGLLLGWIGAYLPLKRQLVHIEPCH